MIKATVDVTQIEQCSSKQGSYIKIHYSDSKGPHKLAVFDKDLVKKFVGSGSYYIEIDKPEGEKYWKLLAAEKRNGGAPSSGGRGNDRAQAIGCAMKCAAEVMAAYAGSGIEVPALVQHTEPLMRAFLTAAENIEKSAEEEKILADQEVE